MKTPMRARLKKCAACGKAKPLTEYAHHGHKMCSACIGFTNSRAGDVLDMLRRKADAQVRNTNAKGTYSTSDMHQVMRPGADDHERHPSRNGSELTYRDGRVEII